MKTFEFKNEEDYRIAQKVLIDMHEKNPPAPREPLFIHCVEDEEAPIFSRKLVDLRIEHQQERL